MESLQLGWLEQGLEFGPEYGFQAQSPWDPAWVVPEWLVGVLGQLVLVLLMLLVVRVSVHLHAAVAGLVFALLVVHGCGGPSEAFA